MALVVNCKHQKPLSGMRGYCAGGNVTVILYNTSSVCCIYVHWMPGPGNPLGH